MIPEISIITPVYNGLPYIKESVESVLKQDYTQWEMIISDNGSTDSTRGYLDTIEDDRIKIFKQSKNLGIFGNLNFLFEQAKAPVSQILCADDYFAENSSLKFLVNYWQHQDEQLGFVRFNSRFRLEAEKNIPATIKAGQADLWFYLFGNMPGNLSNVSLRTHIVKEAGMFNQTFPYAGDFEFWVRAAQQFDFRIEDKKTVYVRRHPKTASNLLNKKGELVKQKKIILQRLYEAVSDMYPQLKRVLKIQGTLYFDVLQRDAALKQLINGSPEYIKQFRKQSSDANFTLQGTIPKWLIYLFTLGGRIGRSLLADYIISKIDRENNGKLLI